MELKKTNESVTRSFDADGNQSERVDSINYNVLDAEGNVIGNAYVNSSECNCNVRIYGNGTVEEGEERLKAALGIE